MSSPFDILDRNVEANYEEALARLDDEQRHVAAWRPTDRNLRIQATAGSGKTTTLVALAATLLRSGAWPAAQLVLTTFSRKAADEIIKRVGDLVDPTGVQMNTWHGLGLRVLRQLEPDKWNIRRCIELPIKQRAKDVPSSIQLWRDVVGWWDIAALGRKGLKLDMGLGDILDCHRLDMANGRRLKDGPTDGDPPAYLEAWTLYEQLKKKLKLWDWDDVLYAWQDRLHARDRAHPLVVLVDEAQDNSRPPSEMSRGSRPFGTPLRWRKWPSGWRMAKHLTASSSSLAQTPMWGTWHCASWPTV